MKKWLTLSMLVFSVFIIVIGNTTAQSTIAEDYNWCIDPEEWGDGRCDNNPDPNVSACMWDVGWYMPRIEAGEISIADVASTCFNVQIQEVFVQEDDSCKRLLVVLIDSPFFDEDTRVPDLVIEDTSFNGMGVNGNCGLEIHGTDDDNFLAGGNGDDIIFAYDGLDIIIGDAINSDIAPSVDEILSGDFLDEFDEDDIDGLGIDILDIEDLIFGDFEDLPKAGNGNDQIDGGDGLNIIIGDSLIGSGGGNDDITGGDDVNIIIGDSILGEGTGNDKITGGDGVNVVIGDVAIGVGSGNDNITGGDGVNIIMGDTLLGVGEGDDNITTGDATEDTGIGGALGDIGGDLPVGDEILDESFNVVIGDSAIGIGEGNDTINTGDGTDIVVGDVVVGVGLGDDEINTNGGSDIIVGDAAIGIGEGDDDIDGGDDSDLIIGDAAVGEGNGDDTIQGGKGDDAIAGDVIASGEDVGGIAEDITDFIGADDTSSGNDDIDGGEDVDGGDETNTAPGDDDNDISIGDNSGDDVENVEDDGSLD